MPRKDLTTRQQEILDFIRQTAADLGYPPTMRQIGDHFGIKSPNGVRDHLKALDRKGHIKLRPNTSRGIEIPGSPVRGIPLVGRVAAGSPILAVENIEDHLTLERLFPVDGRVFALRVKGQSMTGDGIRDGDVVIVRPQPSAEPGDIVVALLDDEATVKRFEPHNGRIRLLPSNPDFQPIDVDASSLEIAGVVIGVIRKFR